MDGPGPFADEGTKGLSQKKSWPELKNVIAQLAQRSSRGLCHPRLAQEQGQKGKGTSSKERKISKESILCHLPHAYLCA